MSAPRASAYRLGLARIAPLFAAAFLAGCAATTARTPSAARPRPGYEARVDALTSVDASALAGRRIALDPGHGGLFRGALGVKGLTEAEVNLGVSLHLRGLLEARGATVFMTRTDDRDFTTPTDSSLRGDLAARMVLANAFHPDLFISVHHNADAGGLHDKNEIQTYYKLGDEGPSLDAAESIHRFLVRNLGIEKHRIVPGNYYVLRNSEAPGLLTESSYITNPDVESKLVLASKQRLEAEALYLGIADYFARPVPVIEEFVAVEEKPFITFTPQDEPKPDTTFRRVAAPILRARISGAFDDYELELDGRPLVGVRRDDRIEWRPAGLEGGTHEALLKVRLAGQGSAREERLRFRTERTPLELEVHRDSPPHGPEGGWVAVRIDVTDEYGLPFRDSTWIRVSGPDRRWVTPNDTLVVARDGVAWAYFRATRPTRTTIQAWVVPAGRPRMKASESNSIDGLTTPWGTHESRVQTPWLGFLRKMPGDSLLLDAPGTRESQRTLRWLNRDGFAVLEHDSLGHPIVPSLSGYRLWADGAANPAMVAIAGGALQGRRITIDPDGGGDDPAGTGRDGTRAANLNLDVARALGAMLEAAGAEVRLTRDGDFALSDVERVEISEAFHADRFLRIGHRAQPPRAGYYFSSAGGKRWAESAVSLLAKLGLPKPGIAEDAQYPLQQTSCPALYIAPARIDDAASETRLRGPGTLRAEAYALFLSLAREWAPSDWPLDSLEVRDDAGRPLAGALVTLEARSCSRPTPPDGCASPAPSPVRSRLASHIRG